MPYKDIERRKAKQKEYYLAHKEEIKQRTKIYSQLHRERQNLSKKKWAKNHPEYEKTRVSKWKIANPEAMKIIRVRGENKRRAIKRNVLVSITLQEMNELIQNSKNICFWCDEYIPEGQMHLDHVYPLSKGGGHTISNIVVSCADCNMKKHNKDPEVWLYEVLSDNKS